MNDVIEIHTVGDSCCLYNPGTNFLAVVNRSAKLIAELANAGKSEAEISRHIAELHGEEIEKISRSVRETLAAIHDEGGGEANPPAIRDFAGHGVLFQQGYTLPNDRFVRLEIECAEIFGVVSDLAEPYECPDPDLAVRPRDLNGVFPRLSGRVARGLRCPASPRHALLAENLGKPSLWVIISAPWYYIIQVARGRRNHLRACLFDHRRLSSSATGSMT